jgi:hypothetical protein
MRFAELKHRLTGISCPIFGISWEPSESEIEIARRVIAYLEDRRVLYVPHELEVPRHCVRSVLEMRRRLTGEIGDLGDNSDLAGHLRAMRKACRKFLSVVQRNPGVVEHGAVHGHWANRVFNSALGELRGVVGVHLVQIAAKHGLDVEDHLAVIMPAGVDGDDDLDERDLFLLGP